MTFFIVIIVTTVTDCGAGVGFEPAVTMMTVMTMKSAPVAKPPIEGGFSVRVSVRGRDWIGKLARLRRTGAGRGGSA